jgi:nucleoside-diphosphate-sugar epimerase
MKRAFVTGASGFIGAAVVRRLLSQGWDVAVLQRGGSLGQRLHGLEPRLRAIASGGDNVAGFAAQLREWQPQAVFHLGWAGVGNVHRNDAALQLGNVQFACELATVCADCGVQHFLGAGSQAEYGPKQVLITESECPNPTTLYGAAKLSACVLTQRICELAGVRHAWLRIFSTYGPGDNPDWLLPGLIRQLLAGQRPSLTACEQTWDYLHVDDAAAAFEAVASSSASGIFNLASGVERPLRQIIELVRDLVEPTAELGFGEVPYRPDQVMRMQVSVERLANAARFSPQVDLADGLKQSVAKSRASSRQEK